MKTLRGDHNLFIRVNKDGSKALKIRPFRWTFCILLALAFILSYKQDVQVLEGSMIASRLMGFHMVDLFSGLEKRSTLRNPIRRLALIEPSKT